MSFRTLSTFVTVCFLGLDGPGTSATVGSLLLTAADFPSLLWMVHPLFLLAVGRIVAAVQSESAQSPLNWLPRCLDLVH